MAQSASHYVICVGAAGFHALFAAQASFADGVFHIPLAGAVAALAALAGATWLVLSTSGVARNWAKAALTLSILAPAAWWGVTLPVASDLVCIGNSIACGGEEFYARRTADVTQAYFATAIVAIAAFTCAVFSASLHRQRA